MSATIYKYPLTVMDEQTLLLPFPAHVLSVQDQGGQLVLWAIVRPDQPQRPTRVRIIGTGHSFSEVDLLDMRYLCSVQQRDGQLVWHVFVQDFAAHPERS